MMDEATAEALRDPVLHDVGCGQCTELLAKGVVRRESSGGNSPAATIRRSRRDLD
jgi:hypothetical protein